jgi:uncharacterized OB-fold protein
MSTTRPSFPLPDVEWAPAAPFWAGAATGQLVIPRCDACGRYCWYPREACPRCQGSLSWVSVSGQGHLFSWVVVTHAFLPQFQVPYVTGLVALAEDERVRLATKIVDCRPEDLDFGLPMAVVFRRLTFGGVDGAVMAPLFRPASVAAAR